MPPKASAGGGRRKTVRKTVRRTTPRSNSRAKAQAPAESPPPSPAPLTAAESHVIAPISEETPKIIPIAEKTPEITPIAEPSSSPSMPLASETTAPESVEEVAAAVEAPAIEVSTDVEAPTAEAPVPEPTPKKTVTRVRKVVKKKIVVKKVPKALGTVKDDLKTEEEAVVPPIVAAEGSNPNSDSIPENTKAVAVEHLEPPLMAQETEVKVEKIEDAEPSAQWPRAEVETEKVASEEVKQEPMQEDEVEQVLMQEDEVEQEQMQEDEVKEEQMQNDEVKQEQMQEDEVKQEQMQEDEMKQEEIESVAAEEADTLPDQDKKDGIESQASAGDVQKGISERQRRRKTEIFIGGLDRDAKEEDIRRVFETVGEILEVRMMMDAVTGKNKGYAFLRYAEAAQAKKAVTVFKKVEVCGKLCGAAALEGNDTIFLGSIDKTWKKEDIMKLLHEIGVEKIDAVTVMTDPKNADLNRGFAFLELESNRDAQKAFKLLQKKDVFGKGRNIKVAWAEPLNDPDEEEMQKVKSVYVEGIPFSWGEEQLKERFEKFGNIERVVLARNIRSAKRKDFAFVNYKTREDALSCIELFEKELMDNGSKISVKVSLAKPISKGKQNKGGFKFSKKDDNKDKTSFIQRDMKLNGPSSKGNLYKGGQSSTAGDRKSSSTHEVLEVMRHQTPWKQGQPGYARGPNLQDYSHASQGGKRAFAALGDEARYSDLRGYPRPRLDTFPPAGPGYGGVMPHAIPSSSLPYQQRPSAGYTTGGLYGAADHPSTYQMRQGGPPYYGGNLYPRY